MDLSQSPIPPQASTPQTATNPETKRTPGGHCGYRGFSYSQAMAKKKGAPPRYTAEVKSRVLEAARTGRSLAELSKEFGPSPLSIRNWLRESGPTPRKQRVAAAPTGELEMLRAQNKKLRELVISLLG